MHSPSPPRRLLLLSSFCTPAAAAGALVPSPRGRDTLARNRATGHRSGAPPRDLANAHHHPHIPLRIARDKHHDSLPESNTLRVSITKPKHIVSTPVPHLCGRSIPHTCMPATEEEKRGKVVKRHTILFAPKLSLLYGRVFSDRRETGPFASHLGPRYADDIHFCV
jgi:hypothetical protein